jgi:Lar family restriction alleviation protein
MSGADTVELKPCPFCGGEACLQETAPSMGDDTSRPEVVWVSCSKCGASSQQIQVNWKLDPVYVAERSEAIAAWNTRATQADALAVMREAEGAMREFIYETTHLSPMEADGAHWCKISGECLSGGRTTLANLRAAIARARGAA